jgi:hypothetical protein
MLYAKRTIASQTVVATLCFLILATSPVIAWDSLVGRESCEFAVSQMAPEEESATLIIAAYEEVQ